MTSLHLFDPVVHILIQLAVIHGGADEQRQRIFHTERDQIRVETYNLRYLYPFQNCTTMLFTSKNFVWEVTNKASSAPIIFLNYDTRRTSRLGSIIYRKFSLQRRRNFAPHCWATSTILPENEYFTQNRKHPDFIGLQRCFIDFNIWSQYFILVTNVPSAIQKYVKSEFVLSRLSLKEVIIVDITHFVGNGQKLDMNYYNIYYTMSPSVGIDYSEPWYQIDCLPSDCFKQLTEIGKNVSRLNKYSWYTYSSFDGRNTRNVRDLFGHTDIGSIQLSTHDEYRRLANLTSFHGFLSFWILQDVVDHNFTNYTPLHYFTPIRRLSPDNHRGINFIIYDLHSYSYVSCYKVSSNSGILNTLTSPFDRASWTLLGICCITVVAILTSVVSNCSNSVFSDSIFLVAGLTMESSVLLSRRIFEARFFGNKHESIGLYTIVGLWMILVGTILTNWYKSCFTIEMIVPRIYESPWTSVTDVEGIRILMPFSLQDQYDSQMVDRAKYFLYKNFYIRLYFRCLEKSQENVAHKRLIAHAITARKLYDMLLPHFEISKKGERGIFAPLVGNPPPYNQSALQDYPIHPVKYDKGDTFEIIKSLSTCGKVALMDSKENIATITNFLNDNQKKITYVKGDDDLFNEIRGWTIFPARYSYVEERLKLMISSGIFAHWEFIYNLWRPKKLLNYYANWSHPKLEAVSRLDFDSKITPGFYIYGICLILSTISLLVEIGRFRSIK
ncbi:hypothetical protein Fcan01_18008 [Folsomia candida]|uniref:Uncharacterized protein n=1 Tax=Folsomia candida TaxID=158441 RepID=A0A226DPN3_FOLCA|nr:hypothetical protein Fcan01_18008 [Folsomia candida]